jgi:putative ABC transport system permease protein
LPKHLSLFVLGESLTVGVLGGLLGVGVSYPLINNGIGRFIEENMGGIFPYFRIEPMTAVAALGLSVAFSVAAAAIPAYRVAGLNVTDALRRVG